MLPTLLVLAMSLSPISSLSQDSSHEQPLRAQVAKGLSRALDLSKDADSSGLIPLMEAAEWVSSQLGESHLSKQADELVYNARWRALTDNHKAAKWLEGELSGLLGILTFEPVLEADLPVGFPAPTPVQEIELKLYPEYRSAVANMGMTGSNGAFWKLFMHITNNDIPMTAPVEMTYEERGKGMRESKMAFLYGDPKLGAPGAKGFVVVSDQESNWVVSLGCRGRESGARTVEARDVLLEWIEQRPELEVSGKVRVMGYNSPAVRGSKRYFEVQIPVRKIMVSLIDFGQKEEAAKWTPVNDTVMGGRSNSRMKNSDDGYARFTGSLSLENNGGFASVRSGSVAGDLVDVDKVTLKIRGDGKIYKLRMRSSATNSWVTYQASFKTENNKWSEVTFSAEDFTPVLRGRVLRDVAPLSFEEVTSLGLMISDKQTGDFELQLAAIELR